jgi:ATP-dependent DNA ligase
MPFFCWVAFKLFFQQRDWGACVLPTVEHVFDALRHLPGNTVVDGEIVALDDRGRSDFKLLQHSRSQAKRICFVFDLLVYDNREGESSS